MFGAEDAQIMAYQRERKEKQQYLRQYIQDYGYDPADFAQYMEWQRGKFTSLNLNTFVRGWNQH